ncbi:MAG: pseudouridylate synthase [Deltaproteobacteria bacterium]|nr:pseudouridylate synthase [Deltaproteobacteria bacterium]
MTPTPPLPILYQDDACVAVAKPAGLLVHPVPKIREKDSVLRRLREHLGRWVYPVHRLDRPTSGALVMALSPEAAQVLAGAFREGRVEKAYHAVVRGWTDPEGEIDRPLRDKETGAVRPARTRYRRLATAELPIPVGPFPTARYSLLEVRPLTGRTHQIRRHLSGIAHPVVGDTVHGDGRHNRMFRERLGVPGLLLHARVLVFPSPATGEPVRVTAPFDERWRRALDALGWAG